MSVSYQVRAPARVPSGSGHPSVLRWALAALALTHRYAPGPPIPPALSIRRSRREDAAAHRVEHPPGPPRS